jgi:hypothetical protein
MNKNQRLDKLAETIVTEQAALHLVRHVSIFYGDCSCEYTQQRRWKRVGWHCRITAKINLLEDYERGRETTEAYYLGASFEEAKNSLSALLERTIRRWEKDYAAMPSTGEDIPA